MRLSEDQKLENRSRILATASRLFRERGIEATSVADLMNEAGFTHGGFYNHFESKEALVTEVCASWRQVACEAFRAFDDDVEAAYRQYVESYLSAENRDNPGQGCLIGTISGEAAHQSAAVQEPLAEVHEATIKVLARRFAHLSRAAARVEAIAAWSAMVGALTLARSVVAADPKLSDDILAACRKKLLA